MPTFACHLWALELLRHVTWSFIAGVYDSG
jgi:hypothetical protein